MEHEPFSLLFHVPRSMLHDFYQHLPQYIDPIAFSIGSFAIHWYALSYVVGFLVVYGILMWRIKNEDQLPVTSYQLPEVVDFMLVIFFAALIGGRAGYVLFYNLRYFLNNPLAIVSPYVDGQLVGIYGMSYHGALIGAILAGYVFAKIKKLDFFAWADFVVVAVPAGYFFGRIGNFLNGELYGRITTSPLGMYFAGDQAHLRWPSQLLEALLEGFLLFTALWVTKSTNWRKKNKPGSLLAIYLIGYGSVRIVAEQFRQPDSQLGLLFGFFTMGQLLSVGMICIGLFILIFLNKKFVIDFIGGKNAL